MNAAEEYQFNRVRALRLWHWRQAMAERMRAKLTYSYGYSTSAGHRVVGFTAQIHNEAADFHIYAVQTLNDMPGCRETTAEQDESSGWTP